MKKTLLLLICFSLLGCFDVTERINHKKDDSGEYSLVVDFSRSWIKTKSAIWLEEVDGVAIPNEGEIKERLNQFLRTSSKTEGVTNSKATYDFKNYIFKIQFEYKNVTALNEVLRSFDKNSPLTHFKSDKANFERIASYPIPKNIIKNNDKKEDLLDATIVAIYSFEEPVSASSNTNTKYSKSKKTVFLKQNIWSVLHNNTLMNNTISFTTP